jgi:hypothetical protein
MYNYSALLPRSLERFILKLSGELQKGNNVILRVPEPNLTQDFLATIHKVVRDNAGPEIEPLDAGKRTDYKSLLSFLNDELTSNRATQRKKNIQAHFQPENGHFSVWALVGLESWHEAAQKQVVKEFGEVIALTREQNRTQSRVEGKRFFAIVTPPFPLPPETEGLTIMNWWGVTTPADHEFIFEEFINELSPAQPQYMYWWLKALSLSVGGDDPDLIRTIVREAPLTLSAVKDILLEHPLSRNKKAMDNYSRHLLFRNLSPDPGKPPELPGERLMWSQGLLAPNRYSLYHPVMLTKDATVLEKTIAMGQREVFFPLTDQVHAFISFQVEDKLGSMEHIFQNDPDKDAKFEKIQTEISFLHLILSTKVKKTPKEFPELGALVELARLWTRIRHLNAHIRMLPHEDFKKAVCYFEDQYEKFNPRGNRA